MYRIAAPAREKTGDGIAMCLRAGLELRDMEMLQFHKAAGGEVYTGLTHAYQPYLDLTDHLRTGRAILLGRGASPSVSGSSNGA